MKLSEAREAYYTHSGKASEVARSLAFAGIAVVWIFKIGDGAAAHVDRAFLLPLIFLVSALASDLLQYVLAALLWGVLHRLRERELSDIRKDPEIVAPKWINWPAIAMFWGKLAFVSIAYFTLIRQIWLRWV